MKHGSIKAVCLVVLACIAVLPAFSDERIVDFRSVVLESFNGETAHEWLDGKHTRNFEFSWAVNASKFAAKSTDENGNEVQYPISTYVNAWPYALFGYNRDGKELKSFGINGSFERQGYNWIDIYPVKGEGSDAEPFEIPIPGRLHFIDLWVWGANLNYYMEAYVRDYQGIVHRIQLGNINHTGWKNLKIAVPNHIPQTKRIQPIHAPLQFVKFRIWTTPAERVDNFYVYLKQFKVLTDTFESLYDGDELADPDYIPELWGRSGGNSNTDK